LLLSELRYIYWSGKTGYKRQRSQRVYPFKKRRSFYYSSLPNGDVNISYKGIYAPKKAIDSARFGAVEHGGVPSVPCDLMLVNVLNIC